MTESFSESIVWEFREENLSCYSVYGLAATGGGRVLAFAEGRIERWDASPHHIVLKRSEDHGATWRPTQYLIESRDGGCYANPTPLVERRAGKVFLFYARNYDQAATRVFYVASTDGGTAWSDPVEVTPLFSDNQHGWTFHLPGPGHGIQLESGRLVLQVWHRRAVGFPAGGRRYGVSVIYSDDAGGTWHHGGIVPPRGQINESRIAQLKSGELMLNARSGPFVTSSRYFSISRDEGATWETPRPCPSLTPSYATDAGFIALQKRPARGADWLLFSRPAHESERRDMTIGVSDDEGRTWKSERTIHRGGAHYSDLVELPNGDVGLLYGRGVIDAQAPVEGNVREVAFAKFTLGWLTGDAG